MLLARIVAASDATGATTRRLEKIAHLTSVLRELTAEEIAIGVAYLAGRLPQGRIGVGPSLLRRLHAAPAGEASELNLRDVDAVFTRVGASTGAGSVARREQLLGHLWARATRAEQGFLARLALGELRQGALDGLMQEAVARAFSLPVGAVRRATMLAGDVAVVAQRVADQGRAGLAQFSLRLLSPVQPMLAQPASDLADALGQHGRSSVEYKLDGVRVQVHRDGSEVRVFTRSLHDVTGAVPEVVTAARSLPVSSVILDGEVLALRDDATPHRFQTTMRRFGRRLDVERVRRELPLSVFFFDLLHAGGEDLIDQPAAQRIASLDRTVPAEMTMPKVLTSNPDEASRLLSEALARGHEGVMLKDLAAPYEAGRRGKAWLKVKPSHTLDLVVLAAEWGSGRRRGKLSNIHLGARDPRSDGFVMLGKTFKGMTDEMLAWQTEQLLALATRREGHVVHVRPEVVVEVAFDAIQASPHYPAGLALRFARVKRYRTDKRASEADTLATVQAIYRQGHRP